MAKEKDAKYSSKQLSELLDIPYKYLTKVMTKLTKSDIIDSIKGKYGGFILIKDIKDIKIIDIAIIFDDIDNKKCVLIDTKCNFEQKCIVHDKWQKPRCAIDDFLTKTTLYELIEKD
jgi:Rrf2 family protein